MELKESIEQEMKLEQLIESLIVMQGRSNRRLEELLKRVHQIEQYILEAGPQATATQPLDEGYSFIARLEKGKTTPKS
ncbi:hypothetical protein [Neobacillus sp. LXY-4]|uniref:hypothetical protein n=1 Tax=Neobacillus sp. LXY-4 TaxID=3379826 RepID=UPI003EE28E1B